MKLKKSPLQNSLDELFHKVRRYISESKDLTSEKERTLGMILTLNQVVSNIRTEGKCPPGKVEDPKTGLCVPR